MAVKVVYDATRGLVQENDPTGAGGFEIKDAFLDQGVEGAANAPIPATQGGKAITTSGVTLVSTTANDDVVTVANPTATNIGQMKTVIYIKANNNAHNLLIKDSGANTIATLQDKGDVALLMWSGANWLLVGQS